MQITEIRDMRVRRRLWLLGYLPTEEPGKTVADLVREAGVGANYVYYSLLNPAEGWPGSHPRVGALDALPGSLPDHPETNRGRDGWAPFMIMSFSLESLTWNILQSDDPCDG
jgi:hypothetical protein